MLDITIPELLRIRANSVRFHSDSVLGIPFWSCSNDRIVRDEGESDIIIPELEGIPNNSDLIQFQEFQELMELIPRRTWFRNVERCGISSAPKSVSSIPGIHKNSNLIQFLELDGTDSKMSNIAE
jgi:hypothetical protein